jgi:hypothetical protein
MRIAGHVSTLRIVILQFLLHHRADQGNDIGLS